MRDWQSTGMFSKSTTNFRQYLKFNKISDFKFLASFSCKFPNNLHLNFLFPRELFKTKCLIYTTLIKQPHFGNLSKSLPIVNMKISSPDSDLAPTL